MQLTYHDLAYTKIYTDEHNKVYMSLKNIASYFYRPDTTVIRWVKKNNIDYVKTQIKTKSGRKTAYILNGDQIYAFALKYCPAVAQEMRKEGFDNYFLKLLNLTPKNTSKPLSSEVQRLLSNPGVLEQCKSLLYSEDPDTVNRYLRVLLNT